jgi:hypothetical protein
MHAARVLLTAIPMLVFLLAQTHTEESRPPITLNVIPSVMKLSPLETREARVVIGNPTAAPLQELPLSSFTDNIAVDTPPMEAYGIIGLPHADAINKVRQFFNMGVLF